ncbi:MAG: two-component sensor histidine kinase [Desulfobacterales bacterium]|nr:two-component sensor histidine kinase [Desulfobacterales bacterium]
MSFFSKLKPVFWDEDLKAGPIKSHFHFRRIWEITMLLTAGVTLVPLITLGIIDYNLARESFESEALLRMDQLVSNTRRSVSFYLAERKNALDNVVRYNAYQTLAVSDHLESHLVDLKRNFADFTRLGIYDAQGKPVINTGPDETPVSRSQKWMAAKDTRIQITDTFRNRNGDPRFGISAGHGIPRGGYYTLRADLDARALHGILKDLELGEQADVFVVNTTGVLQTPSRYYGDILEKVQLPLLSFIRDIRVTERTDNLGEAVIIGYADIEGSPFMLMIVQPKSELMKSWLDTHMKLIWILALSILVVIMVIIGVGTYLVDMIFKADQERAMIQHRAEHTNQMASIGRLAAGVAHEINNPLAIINEKAGLVKDLFTFKEEYKGDDRLMQQMDHIIGSVERCAYITKRLLRFARHIDDIQVREVDLSDVIRETLEFLHKEAEYRSITVEMDASEDISRIMSDRGKLQQIFLNLINNAFAAMSDGGHLDVRIEQSRADAVSVHVTDNGIGISRHNVKRIFEPFFSTKKKDGGTGLGLSISYGLVQEINGRISVESELGQGTTFHITLPLFMDEGERTCT